MRLLHLRLPGQAIPCTEHPGRQGVCADIGAGSKDKLCSLTGSKQRIEPPRSILCLFEEKNESIQHVTLEGDSVLGIAVELGIVGAGVHFMPDLDVRADLSAHADEGFHDDGTVIVDVFQRFTDFAPGGAATAGDATVAFAGVEMAQVLASCADGSADAVFFDIHMKGVEHDLCPGMVDFLDKLDSIFGSIEQVAFEAVQDLQAIIDTAEICDPGQSFPVA